MDLGERKRKILSSIVNEYIVGAEPVGSRHIAKNYGLGLSPATIRNEMADLEEMGYLEQPHTSAGRVPSVKGYRFYVNELMTGYQLTLQELDALRHMLELRVEQFDKLIGQISAMISRFTNYTTVLVSPEMRRGTIKSIELVPIDKGNMLVIVVTNEGVVNHKRVKIPDNVDEMFIMKFSQVLKEHLSGAVIGDINVQTISQIKQAMETNYELLFPVLDFISELLCDMEDGELYVRGEANILNFPEYSDVGKAREFFDFLSDPDSVREAIASKGTSDDIDIKIGTENKLDVMRDCSVITTNYYVGDKVMGRLGIIGPTRMDYAKTVAKLKRVTESINQLLHDLYFDDSN